MKLTVLAISLLAACGNLTPSGDMTATNTPAGGGLEGGSNSGSANLSMLTTCADNQILKWDDGGSAWECASDETGGGGTGDIDAVTAGAGLSGGGTSGPVTLDVQVGDGLEIISDFVSITNDCADGEVLKSASSGTQWNCASDSDSGGDITSVVAGVGLINGGSSGAVTLDVACGTGITCNTNDITLDMATGEVTQTVATTGTITDLTLGATTTVVKFTGAGGLIFNGMTGGASGRVVKLDNSSGDILIIQNNTTSSANNRFLLANDNPITLTNRQAVTVVYSSTDSRWHVMDKAIMGGSSISVNQTTGVIDLAMPGVACSAGSFIQTLSTTGTGICVAAPAEVGDISSVVAGAGLTGGATSGAATLDIAATSGGRITVNANDIGVTFCGADQTLLMNGTGTTWGCYDPNVGSGTASRVARWVGTNTLGVGQIIDDNSNEVKIGNGSDAASRAASRLLITMNGDTELTIRDSTSDQEFFAGTGGSAFVLGTSTNHNLWIYRNTVAMMQFGGGTYNITLLDDTGITGAFTVTGNVTLGDATSDQVSVAGDLTVTDDTILTDQLQVQGHTTLGNGAVDVVAFNNSEPKDVGTAPSSFTCGTGPSVTSGGRFSFNVHTGTGLASTCVINFSTAFAATPTCVASAESKVAAVAVTAVSTGSVSISEGTGGDISDANIYVICIGH